ncbi:TIGR00725 family protein [Telmatospirillum siberiense]|uniref:TIGR00725 family protein n=1 Tax=Telmatospirillum siberiense TaxID=382514 RepID=A0A2N3PVW0_9PROT|nr:TIGR00725 family protein [Telmatospirillum siberiense]PKU24530.1 TIGR00725 family protein [Telmatospirillum siberiense]
MSSLTLSRSAGMLYSGNHRFDAWSRTWVEAGSLPSDGQSVTPREAIRWLSVEGGARSLPVAVVGPRNANALQVETAEAIGRSVAELGLPLLTGGRKGVMEAASRGAFKAGGLTIGFIPDEDWRTANPYVRLPLATGLGPARNVLIARSAEALIAVGGEYGTLSEMAFGMHFGKPVFSLCNAPSVAGVTVCTDVEECVTLLAESLLRSH